MAPSIKITITAAAGKANTGTQIDTINESALKTFNAPIK